MALVMKTATSGRMAIRRVVERTSATLVALAIGFGPTVAAAKVRDPLSLSTPFEVSDSPAGNYLAALVAGAERDTVAAATFFREALRYDPRNAQLIEHAFVAALSNGNMQDAFVLADRLIARDPSNGLAHLALGIKAIKDKKFSAARSQFGSGGGPGRERDLTATLLTAWSYAGAGDFKKAMETADKLQDSNFVVFREYHEGLIADLANQPFEAAKHLTPAYQADKTTLRLVDAYGRFMARRGNRDEAVRAYEAFDKLLPNHPVVTSALADIKANKTLDPVVRTAEQGAAEVLYGLGAAGSHQGDELAAMIYLRLSLFLAPQNAIATLTLADLYERIKQYERAIDVYNTVPAADPLRVTADIQTGQIFEEMGRPDDAIKALKKIVAERPTNEDAVSALGNVQRMHKDFEAAALTYGRAIEISGKSEEAKWPLYYFRGICLERQKQWSKAEADFKYALKLAPNQPLILNYLGYSWVDQGMNLDEAFTMLHRAVELKPTDGYIVDSLGWADYKLGRYEEAAKELERAIDLKPSDPVINDHLGDAYWRVGRKLEAHFQWNHARDLGPEPEDRDRILAKIKNGLPDDPKPTSADAEAPKNGG